MKKKMVLWNSTCMDYVFFIYIFQFNLCLYWCVCVCYMIAEFIFFLSLLFGWYDFEHKKTYRINNIWYLIFFLASKFELTSILHETTDFWIKFISIIHSIGCTIFIFYGSILFFDKNEWVYFGYFFSVSFNCFAAIFLFLLRSYLTKAFVV